MDNRHLIKLKSTLEKIDRGREEDLPIHRVPPS